MPDCPLCTIAIPVYNREALIKVALESALAQDAPGLEILVVDNASTDGTWDVLQSYSDPRLRLVRNDHNVGLYGNLNRCLELAQGKYIRILCSDDRLVPGCITREVSLMEQNPTAVLLSTRAREVDAEWKMTRISADEFPPGLYSGEQMIGNVLWLIAHYNSNPLNYPSGILLRRHATQQNGVFTERYKLVGDIDYWLRLFAHGDALVADHIGCEVMVHDAQEGHSVLLSGKMVGEFYDLADRWQTALQQRNLEQPVRRQIAGFAVYTAARFRWKEKRPEIARIYWQNAVQRGFSRPTILGAAVRFAWMVQWRKHSRRSALPPLCTRLSGQPTL